MRDSVYYMREILVQLAIPDAKYLITMLLQYSIPSGVVRDMLLHVVLIAVKFHDQLVGMLDEIQNVTSKRNLPPEVISLPVQFAQLSP